MLPEGNFHQCFNYGEILKMAFPSTKVARLGITCDGELAGIIQGTYSSHFGFGMTFKAMRGPVINAKNKGKLQLVENLLEALENYGKRNRVIQAQILAPKTWRLHEVFHRLRYVPAGQLNEYVVSLEEGLEELWKSISHNKRKNIRKALKEGVEVVQSHSHNDLLTFYSMVQASEKRGGFTSYPLSWFETVWKVYDPELSKIFLGRWKGKSISGVFIVIHRKTVYALGAGSFSEGWKVRPNDIMHWKVMEWAFQHGYSKYHMGLVSEPPPTAGSNAWGIWRWKREWNGSLGKLGVFDKVFLPRYKLMLKAKKLVEGGYTILRRL
jgi:hypothetical protein